MLPFAQNIDYGLDCYVKYIQSIAQNIDYGLDCYVKYIQSMFCAKIRKLTIF